MGRRCLVGRSGRAIRSHHHCRCCTFAAVLGHGDVVVRLSIAWLLKLAVAVVEVRPFAAAAVVVVAARTVVVRRLEAGMLHLGASCSIPVQTFCDRR